MVGREMFRVLNQRNFPMGKLKALASERSVGHEVAFNGTRVFVEKLDEDSFRDVDLALFSAGSDISLMFAPVAVESGALVIDNSSAWRMKENVPLVVPEVNPEDIRENEGIIANPNCCAIPLTVVLEPLRRRAGLERVLVSTYQAASGAGKALVQELQEGRGQLARKVGELEALAWGDVDEQHSCRRRRGLSHCSAQRIRSNRVWKFQRCRELHEYREHLRCIRRFYARYDQHPGIDNH